MANPFEDIFRGLGRGIVRGGTAILNTSAAGQSVLGERRQRGKRQQEFENRMNFLAGLQDPKARARAAMDLVKDFPSELGLSSEGQGQDLTGKSFRTDQQQRDRKVFKSMSEEERKVAATPASRRRTTAAAKPSIDQDVADAEGFAKILDAELAAGKDKENAAFFADRKAGFIKTTDKRRSEAQRKPPRRVNLPEGSSIQDGNLIFDFGDGTSNAPAPGRTPGPGVDRATGLTVVKPSAATNRDLFAGDAQVFPNQVATPESPGEKKPKTFVQLGPAFASPSAQQSLSDLETQLKGQLPPGLDLRSDIQSDPQFYSLLFKAIKDGVPDGKGQDGLRKLTTQEIIDMITQGQGR